MNPNEITDVLATLGWSERELASRLRCSRTLPGKWRKGRAEVPPRVAEWLRASSVAIEKLPPPTDWRVRGGKGGE